jgi:AcrR family transcriptional regulator
VNTLQPSPTPRRTRRQRQVETREALLAAAAEVFAQRGVAGASLDQIAERAGYTRGAIYANFADKDDLFLTLVERHKDAFIDAFDRAVSLDTPDRRLSAVQALLTAGPQGIAADWIVLWTELWLHAVRHPQVAGRLATHERRYRAAVARLLTSTAADLGRTLPASAEELAAEVIALDVGLSLQGRLSPEIGPGALPRAIARLLGMGLETGAATATAPAADGHATTGAQP